MNAVAAQPVQKKKETTMLTKISDTQRLILDHAVQNNGGKIEWFPATLRGGARNTVIDVLLAKALIYQDGESWLVADDGYDALGIKRQTIESASTEVKPCSRANSKQAQVIAMLRRSEGATIAQIMEITGWNAHTVRGAVATFRTKKGLDVTASKNADKKHVYHIA